MTHTVVQLNDLVAAVRVQADTIVNAVIAIGEGISDRRTVHVYGSEFEGAHGSSTQTNTMRGGLKLKRYVVTIDFYSQPRANISEDITAAQIDSYSVVAMLEAQNTGTPFGLSGVHTFHWTGTLGVLEYGTVKYWGSQFKLEFMCH